MECNFVVGQKVMCVSHPGNRQDHLRWAEANGKKVLFPDIGEVCTVREVSIHSIGLPVIRLVEFVNPPLSYSNKNGEIWLAARHFRPVVERKTDISIFKAMLNPSKEGVPA